MQIAFAEGGAIKIEDTKNLSVSLISGYITLGVGIGFCILPVKGESYFYIAGLVYLIINWLSFLSPDHKVLFKDLILPLLLSISIFISFFLRINMKIITIFYDTIQMITPMIILLIILIYLKIKNIEKIILGIISLSLTLTFDLLNILPILSFSVSMFGLILLLNSFLRWFFLKENLLFFAGNKNSNNK